MTKDETLRLALDTLKEVREETFRLMRNGERLYAEDKVWSTIIAIQEALETKDEPVGKFAKFTDGIWKEVTDYSAGIPLYTTPQRKPLTDEQIIECDKIAGLNHKRHHQIKGQQMTSADDFWWHFARAIEAAHGIKE